MRYLLSTTFVLAAASLWAQQPPAEAPNWAAATTLPAVDFTGLTPKQKAAALKSLHVENCICGCNMKLAQCRVLDPACGDSKTLAGMVVQGVKGGMTPDQIHESLINSGYAKARAASNKVLSDPVKIATNGSPFQGPERAKITLVEFSDFQCPYCSRAIAEVENILKAYPKDIKLVFKQFPLEIHSEAQMAAEASLAANAQGKFWPMHDKLFANFRKLSRDNIFLWAKESGLEMEKFKADLQSGKFRPVVEKDVKDGFEAGVQGTPTFFINGQRYNGLLDLASVKSILDAELKK
ncbi:MAG: thioredoxin domain-containing protein [Bryobacteraceae bacterium]